MNLRAHTDFALQVDRPAEQSGQLLGERQPETGSLHLSLSSAINLIILLEKTVLFFGRDTYSGVRYGEGNRIALLSS